MIVVTFPRHKQSVSRKTPIILHFLIAFIVVVDLNLLQAEAGISKGEGVLWNDDYRLNEYETGNDANTIFELHQNEILTEAGYEKLRNIIRKQRVDVVVAGSDLMNMMNTISTKMIAVFHAKYDEYFKKLNIGSTDRPMLYSFLGIQLASQEGISKWYRPTPNARSNIIHYCQALIDKRKRSVNLSKEDQKYIDKIRLRFGNAKNYLAHLVNKNNLNLFMLDNYLELCLKLEPEALAQEFSEMRLFL